jgi:beta-lactam-binding protein with PASTA domain
VVTDVNARTPDGEILAVVPDPGRRVHRGSTVTLHEAITVASVPDLDGLPIAAAERVVRRAGLTPIAQPAPNGDPSLTNRVFRQQPVAGGQVRRGTHVHVHYHSPARTPGPSPRPATAPPTAPPATAPRTTAPPRTSPSPSPSDDRVAVPGVVGQPEQQAVAQLEAVGLDYKRITNERRGPPDGTVLAVVPPAGDRVRRGTTVTLRVAVSTVPVPDLTGVALPDAEAAVRRLGLEPQPEATPNTDPALSNEVYAQEPAARRRLRHGGQVLLRYYAPVTAPTAASPTADEPDRPSDGPDVPEATD